MDETEITNVHKPTKIIASNGTGEVGKMTSREKGKRVTAVCAMHQDPISRMLFFSEKKDG